MATLPMVGDELAGYRLLAVLGRGGMSVVYQAENPRLGSVVALKVLAPELATNDVFRARFLQESRNAASLNHPNVIPIYDMGTAEDLLYIAMRYVAGSDLRSLIRDHHRLPPVESLYLVGQTGRALDLAHQHGLVHRDVKPANILVERGADEDDPDHVFLADFGITKHARSSSGLTATGQFMGTVDYVAPEQIQGHVVDERADLYSLGCVLFECLTGQVPFVKDIDAAVLWAHVEEPAPRASVLRTGLPNAIDDVLAQALAKDPQDRYPTSRAMVAAARDAFGNPDLSRVRILSRTPPAGAPGQQAVAGSPELPPTLPPARPPTPAPGGAAPAAPAPEPAVSGAGLAAGAVAPPAGPGGTGPDADAPGGPRGRRPRVRATAAGAVVLAVVGAGTWLGTHVSDSSSAGQSAAQPTGGAPGPMSGKSMPGQQSPSGTATARGNLLAAVAAVGHEMLPASSCTADGSTHVECLNPVPGVSRVDLRRYPTLRELYRQYAVKAQVLSGGPLRTNRENCNKHHTSGEVSWNHDFEHPRGYSLAQSRSGELGDEQAAGRVFCLYTDAEMHMIWTDNDNRLLGEVVGWDHPSTWRWWRSAHHALNVSHAMTMP